jgi:gluconolactonase
MIVRDIRVKRRLWLIPAALLSFALLFLALAGAQQQPAGPQGASGGGRAQQTAPVPFEITRLDPALDDLLAPDAKWDTIATIPGLSGEGPMWREGKLWFADQKGGNLYAVTADGKLSVIQAMAGGPINPAWSFNQGPNASVTDKDGTVLFCRQAYRDIARVNADGTIAPVIRKFEGKRMNAPNDLVLGPDGALWFTDPSYSTPGVREGKPDPDSQYPVDGVYRYKDGKLTRVISDLTLANGIAFSPDYKILYVNSTQPKPGLHAYDVAADGTLSNARQIDNRGGDGMKIDSKGNIWDTGGGGIRIETPAGKVLGQITFPWRVSNMAWGEDLHSLFAVGANSVFRIRTKVAGQKPMYYRQ